MVSHNMVLYFVLQLTTATLDGKLQLFVVE